MSGKRNEVHPSMWKEAGALYPVHLILDRTFNCDPFAYLVQWSDFKEKRFIGTWEWKADLCEGLEDTLKWIDRWKDDFPGLSFNEYKRKYPIPFTAASCGTCFCRAIHLACLALNDRTLVPGALLEAFQAELGDTKHGVHEEDIITFVDYAINHRARMAGQIFQINLQRISLNGANDLNVYPLDAGVYVIGAQCYDDVRNCFVLRVSSTRREVFDDLGDDGEYTVTPLLEHRWIKHELFVRKVERIKFERKRKKARTQQ